MSNSFRVIVRKAGKTDRGVWVVPSFLPLSVANDTAELDGLSDFVQLLSADGSVPSAAPAEGESLSIADFGISRYRVKLEGSDEYSEPRHSLVAVLAE